ncbi:MAG: enoyl-CoA hydratase/isomerase family protein [Alphaproteobacteria bacterium]
MSEVERADDGAVRVLTLNRPEARNALNLATLAALRAELAAVAAAPAVRARVLTGAGRAFSAGADVKEWAKVVAEGRGEGYDWVGEAHRLITEVAACPLPTLALLNGAAVGIGLDLAIACDFRFAVEDALFTCAYTRMAYPPDGGGTWLLPRVLGPTEAKRFVFTAAPWSAREALAKGLVSDVHPPATLRDEALRFARQLASGPTLAIREAKALIDGAGRRTLVEQLDLERTAGARCGRTRDHAEALKAAVEKRDPVFVGS